MKAEPDWAQALRALWGWLSPYDRNIETNMTAREIGMDWLEDTNRLLLIGGRMVVVQEADTLGGTRWLLAVPARVNSLAHALGAEYWVRLAKAPPKILVSKTATARIEGVRHQVLQIDIAAWLAWRDENRAPEALSDGLLQQVVEQIEHLEEEKRETANTIKEAYAAAKAQGFDVSTLRQVVRIRAMDPDKRREQQVLLDLYLSRLSEREEGGPADVQPVDDTEDDDGTG